MQHSLCCNLLHHAKFFSKPTQELFQTSSIIDQTLLWFLFDLHSTMFEKVPKKPIQPL